jgi:hypothetical protein
LSLHSAGKLLAHTEPHPGALSAANHPHNTLRKCAIHLAESQILCFEHKPDKNLKREAVFRFLPAELERKTFVLYTQCGLVS